MDIQHMYDHLRVVDSRRAVAALIAGPSALIAPSGGGGGLLLREASDFSEVLNSVHGLYSKADPENTAIRDIGQRETAFENNAQRVELAGMETVGDRIRWARKQKGWNQQVLAEACGWEHQSRISGYERIGKPGGREPSLEDLAAMATALGVSQSWLATGEGSPKPAAPSVEPGPTIKGRLPLISWVQAGDWCEAVDIFEPGDAEEWIPFAANHSDRSFALRVRGPSMLPKFQEGEIIVVDPSVSADSGRFVIAKKGGTNEATFKQLMIDGGETYLRALNPDWPEPIIRMTEEWHICGVVIAKMELF